ncbi:MAG: hypothetical protein IJ802_00855 [Kiritimatiellae bacterium]|nr:hypothetical protein [Kiritimatiellia bacterium]
MKRLSLVALAVAAAVSPLCGRAETEIERLDAQIAGLQRKKQQLESQQKPQALPAKTGEAPQKANERFIDDFLRSELDDLGISLLAAGENTAEIAELKRTLHAMFKEQLMSLPADRRRTVLPEIRRQLRDIPRMYGLPRF